MFENRKLKDLILFCKSERIASFKWNGFEFELSGSDPTAKELAEIKADIEMLKSLTNKLHLSHSFKKAG